MSGYHALLHFKHADDNCAGSPVCESLPGCYELTLLLTIIFSREWVGCLAMSYFKPADVCSGFSREWGDDVTCCVFKSTDDLCPWLRRKWVTACLAMASCMLTAFILGSLACEWMLCISVLQISWWCWFLALQVVSDCHALLDLNFSNNACSWFSR